MNTFYAVVVLYNIEITNSQTCLNIEKIKNHDINLIIVDNSTKKNNNKLLCEKKHWTYISMNGNAGLSKAYNRVLDSLINKSGVVIWFDDDSNLTQEYFDHLELAVEENPEFDIFVPIIQGQDGHFWSPNEYRFFKNKQLKTANQMIKNNRFNAINSCTAVRLNVYKKYRYDEKLFLDQVDHSFFEDQREKNRNFFKLNTIINHNFSTKNKMKSLDEVKKRYQIMIPDFLRFCSRKGNNAKYYLGFIKVIGWGIKESFRYRNPPLLLWYISEARKSNKN